MAEKGSCCVHHVITFVTANESTFDHTKCCSLCRHLFDETFRRIPDLNIITVKV